MIVFKTISFKKRSFRFSFFCCRFHNKTIIFQKNENDPSPAVFNNLVSHQNTQLNAEAKMQASNRFILRVWGRLHSLIHYR